MNAADGAGTNPACSFCGAGAAEVNHLISGPGVWICDGCARASYEIIEGLAKKTASTSAGGPAPTTGAHAAVPLDDPIMATIAQVQQAALQGHREQAASAYEHL